jgi:hypothetical protein
MGKHRQGIAFNPLAPTGLMEHSIHGPQMEHAFQSKVYNKLIDFIIKIFTDHYQCNSFLSSFP